MSPPSKHPAPLLTVDDVAEHLKLSSKTIRRWIAAGELPSQRLGRAIRVRHEDLTSFLNRRRS